MLLKKKSLKSVICLLLVSLLTLGCFSITVNASSVKVTDISVEPISIIECTNGYLASDYNSETDEYDLLYYYYEPEYVMEYTVTFSDGTVITDIGNEIEYNGNWYGFDVETDQSYENQWTAGNDYTITVTLMGVSVDVSVSILESPVESIEIEPISIIEGTYGFWDADYNQETDEYDLEYYYYWPEDVMEYAVTLSDGTVISGVGYDIEYNGDCYWFDVETDQSYENQWTAGNDYTMTVTLMGVSVDVPVSILEYPVKSIEIEPISIMEYTNGFWNTNYNWETDEDDLEYYYYEPEDVMKFTVIFNDGTVISGIGERVKYNDEWYWFDVETDQSYENQWTAGNDYTMTVTLMGVSVDVPVTILESPFESFEIEPVYITEGTNGYWTSDYNWETEEESPEYYYYEPEVVMKYTVTLSGGTVISGMGNRIEYNGEWYWFDVETDQSYENQWTAGNTYTAKATLTGVETDLYVTITGATTKGDVNLDGIVNILDATAVQKYLAGLETLNENVLTAADYNGDGIVSIMDATDIQKELAGLI